MDSERIRELTTLLQQALTNIQITNRRSARMDLATYRANLLNACKAYNPSSAWYARVFSPQLPHDDLRENLLDFLREELKEYIYDDRIYAASFALYGGVFGGSSVEDLFLSLLKRAIMDGPKNAALALDDCTKSMCAVFQNLSLLTGVRVEQALQVFDGVWLLPLPSSTAELPPYLPDFSQFTEADFLSKTVLSINSFVTPVFQRPPTTDEMSGFDPFACFNIEVNSQDVQNLNRQTLCQALSLACNSAVQWVMNWSHMGSEELFNLSGGTRSLTGSPNGMVQSASALASIDMIQEARELYWSLQNLTEETRIAIQVPIDRWIKSKAERIDVDQMIDLGIALESLYLRNVRDELAFRFRLRAAWYLGDTHQKRESLMEEFRQIYENRSKAVHTGQLPRNIRLNGETITMGNFVERAQDLCLQSILKVIQEAKLPDDAAWNSIVVGGSA